VPFRACWVFEGWAAVFESLRRQPPKLNFRLSDVPDEGVSGSVDVVESVVLLFFSGRGAAFFIFCSSTSLSLDSKSSLGRDCNRVNSLLPLGSELDEKGVVACLPGCKVGTGIVDSAPCALSFESEPLRRLIAELLLRMCLPKSYPL